MKEIICKLVFLIAISGTLASDICKGHGAGTHLPDPKNCEKFYLCGIAGTVYYKECPKGLHFKAKGGYCTTPKDAECEDITTLPPPTTTPKPVPTRTTSRPVPTTSQAPLTTTRPPIPTRTTRPPPTRTTIGPSPTHGPVPTTTSSPVSSCRHAGFGKRIRYPNDCHKFLICINEDGIEMTCPAKLHFRADLEVCDFPQRANCPWWK